VVESVKRRLKLTGFGAKKNPARAPFFFINRWMLIIKTKTKQTIVIKYFESHRLKQNMGSSSSPKKSRFFGDFASRPILALSSAN